VGVAAGWPARRVWGVQIHLEDLAAHIAGQQRGDPDARWDELMPAYQDLAANIS
jgi:hypothetical protein